jgi:hypothetical protein
VHVATYILPWSVNLRNSYHTISSMGGMVDNAGASANQLTSYNFRLPTVSPAREIMGATFSGEFRACLVPVPTLTSWRFADLPYRIVYAGGFGYGSRCFGSLFRFTWVKFQGAVQLLYNCIAPCAWPYCGARLSCSEVPTVQWAPPPLQPLGFGSLSTGLGTSMSGERSTTAMRMDHIPP